MTTAEKLTQMLQKTQAIAETITVTTGLYTTVYEAREQVFLAVGEQAKDGGGVVACWDIAEACPFK